MPNKNYRAGYRVENKLANFMKKNDCDIAQRMAGSHSPIDVIGFNIDEKVIVVAQCKTNKKIVDKENTKILARMVSYNWEVRAYDVWPDKKEDCGLHFEPARLPLKTITW